MLSFLNTTYYNTALSQCQVLWITLFHLYISSELVFTVDANGFHLDMMIAKNETISPYTI